MDATGPGTKKKEEDASPLSPPTSPPRPPFFHNPELISIALEAGGIGVWSLDVGSGEFTWSSNVEDLLGVPQGTFDGTSSAFESDVHPDDRPSVTAAMQEVLRTHKPSRIMYRVQSKPGEDERWMETVATAMVEAGKPVRLLGLCRDVTHRAKIHHELRTRANQQEAVARLGERALTENNLQTFFDEAVAVTAQILGVELVKILELVPGDAELLLRSGVGWDPNLIGVAHISTGRNSHAGFSLASGGPVILENFATETRFSGSELLRNHGVVSGVSTPIAGRDGRAYGVLTAHTRARRKFSEYDVSFLAAVAGVIAGAIARLQLDRRQEVMIRELRHSTGNLFAQLLALFSQTAKNSRTVAELTTGYEARVLALANAHRLITEGGWKSASLTDLLDTLLAPHLERISFDGPNVFLEPDVTFGLSMALHELTTNAILHGSLSINVGRVDMAWQVGRTARGLTLTINWKERHGPAPKRRRRTGFGSRLITMVIERQLNGKVEQRFEPAGLHVTLIVPITHERWSRAPPSMPTNERALAYDASS